MKVLKEIFYLGYWRQVKDDAVIREDDDVLIVEGSYYNPAPVAPTPAPAAPAITSDSIEPRPLDCVMMFYKSNNNYYRESFEAFVIMNIDTGELVNEGKVFNAPTECYQYITPMHKNLKIFKIVELEGHPLTGDY